MPFRSAPLLLSLPICPLFPINPPRGHDMNNYSERHTVYPTDRMVSAACLPACRRQCSRVLYRLNIPKLLWEFQEDLCRHHRVAIADRTTAATGLLREELVQQQNRFPHDPGVRMMALLSCLKVNIETDRTATEYLVEQGAPNNKSLLSFFAINALELSAPASPVLLEHNAPAIPSGWLQLSGHPKSIAPAAHGSVRKRISDPDDAEVAAYRKLSVDSHASKVVPKFLGVHQLNGEHFIELQDLLNGFHDPNVMDIKIGFRTFSENEVSNTTLREDLYSKMVAIDPSAPTAEEHQQKAITKLRYMLFRENMSSSSEKGFRIEALKMRGSSPVTDMKKVKTGQEIQATISNFVNGRKSVVKDMTKRLKQMRTLIEKSEFFQRHQVVGSSIFIVYDDHKVGVWLIDFAKSLPLPEGVRVDHRRRWTVGNCEEGLLFGVDELIRTLEEVHRSLQQSPYPASKRGRR